MNTKKKLCTATDVGVERTVARILEEKGYDGNPTTTATWFPHSTSDVIPLILPYVGDRAARAVNQLQGYGIRNKVFGIFNAEQEPNFRNLGDPEPFMIRGLDQQYPRDLFTATTMVERILTRNQCTANDEQ
ncbi:hypothetical protein Y032_0305g1957 [Ancylostoma ceylanicum]|uniref:Uncharacterized protein n=1 Tax=Ancylostoma ceylanicum TaxID=53326 RepID=A0A016S3R1_9BILA|nr:hypothetical protein Y032_0305g1957 [Ancylostoma ceylanicum]